MPRLPATKPDPHLSQDKVRDLGGGLAHSQLPPSLEVPELGVAVGAAAGGHSQLEAMPVPGHLMNPYLTLGRGMRMLLVVGVAPTHQQSVPWGPSQRLEPKLAQGIPNSDGAQEILNESQPMNAHSLTSMPTWLQG